MVSKRIEGWDLYPFFPQRSIPRLRLGQSVGHMMWFCSSTGTLCIYSIPFNPLHVWAVWVTKIIWVTESLDSVIVPWDISFQSPGNVGVSRLWIKNRCYNADKERIISVERLRVITMCLIKKIQRLKFFYNICVFSIYSTSYIPKWKLCFKIPVCESPF